MTRLCLPVLSLAIAFAADEPKLVLRNPPFEVVSAAGVKPARAVMTQLLQLRYYLGTQLGKKDPDSVFPIRIVVLKDKQAGEFPAVLTLGREGWTTAVAGPTPSPALMRAVAVVLLESNAGRMPDMIENGLLSLVSTLHAAGPRITLGEPPPGAARDLDWARMRLLATSPDYAGKLRVMLSNLQRGIDLGPASRNAFGKTLAEMEPEARPALTGAVEPTEVSGMPLAPDRDLIAKELDGERPRLYLADLTGRAADYAGLTSVEAADGRALAEGTEAALKAATAAGSKNARVWVEFAKRSQDPARKREALNTAAQLNPRWAEPARLLAKLETDPLLQMRALRQATERDPRDAATWQSLAEVELRLNHFKESDKAWAAAERATGSRADRDRIIAARAAIEERRLNQEAEERRRAEEQKQRELQDLKNKALERIRVAEMKINAGQKPMDPNQKVEAWWDDAKGSATLKGKLQRVECLNGPARLTIAGAGGKPMLLLIRDPAAVRIAGGGEKALSCGPQRPSKPVTVTYNPGRDPKFNTTGEAVSLEFQ